MLCLKSHMSDQVSVLTSTDLAELGHSGMYCDMLCISANIVVQIASICPSCSSLERAPSQLSLTSLPSTLCLAKVSVCSAWALAIRGSNDKDKE